MKQKMIQILKTIIADVRQAYVPVILLSIIGGTGTIFYFYEMALYWSIQIANTPIPLWSAIALVILSCGYMHERHKQKISQKVQIPLLPQQYDIKSKLELIKEKLLLHVANNENIDMYSLSATTKISGPVIKFHLNDLKSKKLIYS